MRVTRIRKASSRMNSADGKNSSRTSTHVFPAPTGFSPLTITRTVLGRDRLTSRSSSWARSRRSASERSFELTDSRLTVSTTEDRLSPPEAIRFRLIGGMVQRFHCLPDSSQAEPPRNYNTVTQYIRPGCLFQTSTTLDAGATAFAGLCPVRQTLPRLPSFADIRSTSYSRSGELDPHTVTPPNSALARSCRTAVTRAIKSGPGPTVTLRIARRSYANETNGVIPIAPGLNRRPAGKP